MVRRSVVDIVVGADHEAPRLLLEQALDDTDAWVRWKALRGIAALGVGRAAARSSPAPRTPTFVSASKRPGSSPTTAEG